MIPRSCLYPSKWRREVLSYLSAVTKYLRSNFWWPDLAEATGDGLWQPLCLRCVPGWPGAHHSVDTCEDLEEWSGGRDAPQLSDTEDEVLVQLVRQTAAEENIDVTIDARLEMLLIITCFKKYFIFFPIDNT